MKTIIAILLASFVSAAFIQLKNNPSKSVSTEEARKNVFDYKNKFGFACSPNLSLLNLDDSAMQIPLLQGWGKYRMPVTANNDSAKIYFEQGINMYYGFHIIEALASFDKATKLEENFAMAYWGKALSYGPNINDLGYSASPEAIIAMQKAKELCYNCTPVEKALIEAMQVRYSTDTTQTREYLNQLYVDAMKNVHELYPESADAAALYTDALIVQHPWDLYDKDYQPKPWTAEIVNTLESVIKQFPDHPGASHYYIHAIEGSEHPERGLAVANHLVAMMPGVAHLVHMPSHIYIRSGYYNEGVKVNEQSVKSYYQYLSKYPAVSGNNFLYIMHNLHMEATCANMDGRFEKAFQISKECSQSFDSAWMDAGGFFGYISQYVYLTPYFTLIRFGKWDDILNTDPFPESRVFATLIWHYGRGLAYSRKHDFVKANIELNALRAGMNNPQLLDHPPAFNPGIAGASVAEKILQGVMAEEQGNTAMAIDVLKDAIVKEDNMLYNEPRDWPHPAREYLGNTLLKAKNYKEAEKIYNEDLKINPNNGWSLIGLTKALKKQGKNKEAGAAHSRAEKAFARSDIKIDCSVF